MISKRARRKLRRRIESDAYAKDARFWQGKIKSAERLGYDQPINRQAAKEIRDRDPTGAKR